MSTRLGDLLDTSQTFQDSLGNLFSGGLTLDVLIETADATDSVELNNGMKYINISDINFDNLNEYNESIEPKVKNTFFTIAKNKVVKVLNAINPNNFL